MIHNIQKRTRNKQCSHPGNHVDSSQSSLHKSIISPGCDHIRASLSLEAAVTAPIFLLFCIALLSFLMILDLQMNLQVSMEETARSMGKKAYLLERAMEGETGTVSDQGDTLDSDAVTLMNVGINAASVKLWLSMDRDLSGQIERSRVRGGMGGIYTHETTYDTQTGVLDMVVLYDYDVPWLPGWFRTLRFAQRMNSHVWVGRSLKESSGTDGNPDSTTVYVTATGTVYHLSPSCHYLDLSIHTAQAAEIAGLRNASGARYDRCPLCAASGEAAGDVYITDYGTVYHTSLSCSGLKRTVIEKDLSEVEGMRVCTKCLQGVAHEH